MTSRSPPPQKRSTYDGVNPGNSNAVNAKQSDQSATGNDKNATENNPVNRGYKQPLTDNNGSLFNIEYYHYPVQKRVDKTDTKKPETKDAVVDKQDESHGREPEHNRKESYTAVERDTKAADARVDSVNYKLEELDSGYKGIPGRVGEVGTNMASNGYKMNELEMRNKLHSAKIHELERELKHVRLENTAIKGHMAQGPPGNAQPYDQTETYASPRNAQPYGQNGTYAPPRGNGPEFDPYQQSNANLAYPGAKEMAQRRNEDIQSKKVYKNEQHHSYHGVGEKDGAAYWGFNKYYNPQYSTAYRREHIPYLTQLEEKEQEEEWMRKRQQEEELVMRAQDKPRTYDYTAPYQALNPPRDINKYFHDSKYLDERPEPKPDEYYFPQPQAPFRENPGTGLSTYERAFIPPGHPKKTQQVPGGLYFVRFHSSGTDEVNVSLKEQQTIIKSFGGHVLGMTGKSKILVLNGDADWRYTKSTGDSNRSVADNVAVMWFPSRSKAFDFFSNSFRNRFKQQGFPTQHGWESHYVPMKTPLLFMSMNTYLIVEVFTKGKPNREQIEYFEKYGPEIVKGRIPNSMPFVAVAGFGEKEAFRPGPLFKDRSMVFISRFSSMGDAVEAWESGKINEALSAGGFMGQTNVSVFQLFNWEDF